MAEAEVPVTDVVVVSSVNDCPPGYTAITVTVRGDAHRHANSANLWEKVLGGQEGERYLCYTKEDKDGKILEDLNIPSLDAHCVPKGFSVLKKTTDGKPALYHRDLVIKRTRKEEAKYAIVEIIVANTKDKLSEIFNRKLEKVNKNHIMCRQIPYKYNPALSTPSESANLKGKISHAREEVDQSPAECVIVDNGLESTPPLNFSQLHSTPSVLHSECTNVPEQDLSHQLDSKLSLVQQKTNNAISESSASGNPQCIKEVSAPSLAYEPPQPSFNQPPQPSLNQPPQPSLNQPPQPSLNQPPQPSLNQPPQPSLNQPPQPSLNQPPQPSLNQPFQPPGYNNLPHHASHNGPPPTNGSTYPPPPPPTNGNTYPPPPPCDYPSTLPPSYGTYPLQTPGFSNYPTTTPSGFSNYPATTPSGFGTYAATPPSGVSTFSATPPTGFGTYSAGPSSSGQTYFPQSPFNSAPSQPSYSEYSTQAGSYPSAQHTYPGVPGYATGQNPAPYNPYAYTNGQPSQYGTNYGFNM